MKGGTTNVPARSDGCRIIYLYEDDLALAAEIVAAFAHEHRDVELLSTEAEVLAVARSGDVGALIMDRMVHGVDSLGIVGALRAKGNRVPVVVISSLVSIDDRIRGLKAGGDDYLVKPFAMGELMARVEALQRRAADDRRISLTAGPLLMDLIKRSVRREQREIDLLPREFTLLEYLMRHANQVVTRAMLLEEVWNYSSEAQTNVVDVHIGNLRRKVDADNEDRLIHSVRGLGFKLTA